MKQSSQPKIIVLYEDNHVIVVNKPINIPTQSDKSHDISLVDLVKKHLKIKYHKPSNVYLGLLHRLDRPVGGLVILAKTSKAAQRLSQQFRQRQIEKKYYAIVEGQITTNNSIQTLTNYLVKNKIKNIVKIYDRPTEQSKKAILEYQVINPKSINMTQLYNHLKINDKYLSINYKNHSILSIKLLTGVSHQIRAQLSHIGHPILGDLKYNSPIPLLQQNIALIAYQLVFQHPTTKKNICVLLF